MNCFNDYQCILNHTYCVFISFYLILFFSLQQISLEQLLIVIKIVVTLKIIIEMKIIIIFIIIMVSK